MKVKVGDTIENENFESGTIVAMSSQWCIFKSSVDDIEFAVPWEEVYAPAEPACSMSSIRSKEIS